MEDAAQSLESILSGLLIEFYDFMIEESGKGPFQLVPNLYRQIAEHETYGQLVTSIANDKSLAKFFPELWVDDQSKRDLDYLKTLNSVVIWSDASSEGITPLMLAASIITQVFNHLWSWADEISLDDALRRLPHSIDLSRKLANKRVVKIPVVVSLHNISLADNDTIQLASAVLRKAIRYDRSRLYALMPGQDIEVVLRFEADIRAINIRAITRDSDAEEQHQKTLQLIETLGYPSMEKHNRRIQDSIDRARLAVVLASRPDKMLAPIQGWQSAVNPLSQINSASMSNARSFKAPYPAQEIDEAAKRRITGYDSLIVKHPDILKTGIRRLLLAITERMYPDDAFIDAIICWENLFSATPETTLRVCGAMSTLLEPTDPKRRMTLYRTLRDLYEKRNNLVHGSSKRVIRNSPVQAFADRHLIVSKVLISARRA